MKQLFFLLSLITIFSCSTPRPDELFTNPNQTSNTTKIGNQIWCCSNLDVVKYNNGDPIPHVKNSTDWKNATYGAWCYYNNDSTTLQTHGRMYNFYAVIDPRGIAPFGFRVPTKNDWTILSDYLGGDSVSGGRLKADSMRFNVTYTGVRGEEGAFCFDGRFQGYWTIDSAWGTYCGVSNWYGVIGFLSTGDNYIRRQNSKMFYGYSVRCVKN